MHLTTLLLRGLAVNRVSWGNMYEFIMALSFVAVATWLAMLRKFPVRHLSGFVLPDCTPTPMSDREFYEP